MVILQPMDVLLTVHANTTSVEMVRQAMVK